MRTANEIADLVLTLTLTVVVITFLVMTVKRYRRED